ncbi:MAG: hypothetical protein H0W64_11800 [Gammaproteobacteria bacterium]|nr:hypothetical protein [Gammaproteobacteria bacterium]
MRSTLNSSATAQSAPRTHSQQSSKAAQRTQEVRQQFWQQISFWKKRSATLPPISNIGKYNQSTVVRAEITEDALRALLDGDKKIKGLPKFMDDFLNLQPSQHRETLALKPELITWSEDGKYILMPNPEQTNHELLMSDPKKAKYEEGGFGLIAWYIHPKLLQESRFADKDKIIKETLENGESLRYGKYGTKENLIKNSNKHSLKKINSFSELLERDNNKETVEDIVNKSNEPYLCGPFDYQQEHLESLKRLKKMVIAHLSAIYDINELDKVELYFHTHYSVDTTTMHLHVRVNQMRHGLELDKSLALDDIIYYLENGKSVKETFMERGVIHKELKSFPFLQSTGYKIKKVANPYFIEKSNTEGEEPTYRFA